MPSDPRVDGALRALERPVAEFRGALAAALLQAEAALGLAGADTPTRTERARRELGAFAEGRLVADRFAGLFAPLGAASDDERAALGRGVGLLRELVARGDDLVRADVPPGGSLVGVVEEALGTIGRAFGAVALTEAVRGGRYRAETSDHLLERHPFRHWGKAERRVAPPLIVTVDGADLHAAGLASFCDGHAKLVLVIRGACPPAALVRLITPGTLVLQTASGDGLERLASFDGPAIAALVPAEAAQFVHDPEEGNEPWRRLRVASPLPAAPRHALGGASAWQMADDLEHLAALARTPFVLPGQDGSAPTPALGGEEAVDRLAAWLLEGAGPLDGRDAERP